MQSSLNYPHIRSYPNMIGMYQPGGAPQLNADGSPRLEHASWAAYHMGQLAIQKGLLGKDQIERLTSADPSRRPTPAELTDMGKELSVAKFQAVLPDSEISLKQGDEIVVVSSDGVAMARVRSHYRPQGRGIVLHLAGTVPVTDKNDILPTDTQFFAQIVKAETGLDIAGAKLIDLGLNKLDNPSSIEVAIDLNGNPAILVMPETLRSFVCVSEKSAAELIAAMNHVDFKATGIVAHTVQTLESMLSGKPTLINYYQSENPTVSQFFEIGIDQSLADIRRNLHNPDLARTPPAGFGKLIETPAELYTVYSAQPVGPLHGDYDDRAPAVIAAALQASGFALEPVSLRFLKSKLAEWGLASIGNPGLNAAGPSPII